MACGTIAWKEKTSDVCGGDACIRNTRLTVCGLVEWRSLGLTDERILNNYPDLSQADLDTVWDYYAKNKQEIDDAIRADQEA